ncbi:MAG: prolipoprotein diacylglyceryl transferase [Candidatus Marinimicrobia bacterium]|nr:prolipoprotein diacylglyceryl transferase [Candidatus Neomarinimicrobiota bacterium]
MVFNEIQQWLEGHINIWQFFGYLNLLFSTGFLLFMGYKRGWDRTNWTLLVTSFVFGTGLGTMLLPSIMGALLGGILVFLLVKQLLQIPPPTSDLFAIYMIIFIGIGRLGCLFSGCCFGTATNLPWGISYGLGNLSHWLHFHTGQINDINGPGLLIHPVQLYESLFLLLGTLPVALQAMRRKIDGRIILSGFISSYFVFRFGIEFIRDMSNVWWSEIYVGPVSLFQIFLLGISGLSLLYAIRLSISPSPEILPSRRLNLFPKNIASPLLFVMLTGTILLSNHFQRIQIILLLVLLTGSIYLRVSTHLASQPHLGLRFSPQAIGAVGLLLLVSTNTFLAPPDLEEVPLVSKSKWLYGINEHNQKLVRIGNQNLSFTNYVRVKNVLRKQDGIFSEDSTLHMQAMEDLKNPRLSYSLGGSFTRFEYERVSCGGESVTETVTSSSLLATMDHEFAITKRMSSYLNGRLEYSTGSFRAGEDSSRSYSYVLGVLNAGLEREVIGVGSGLGIAYAPGLDGEHSPIIPSFYLRLGPREFHLEAGMNDRYYVQPGFLNMHLSLGHKPTRGQGYQVGIGNRGPLFLRTLGPYATVTNLKLGNLPKLDFTFQLVGESYGISTTMAFKFPRH